MQTYQETESLSPLLEQANQDGAIYIRRADGQVFVLKPDQSDRSPLDVGKGLNLNLTREEIIEFIHEGHGNDRW